MKRYVIGLAAIALVAAGCSSSSDDADQPSTTTSASMSSEAGTDTGTDSTEASNGSGSSSDATGASGSVTVDGTTYDFTDTVTCEVGDESSADWRQFTAWTDDGHTHVDITLASGASEWMTSFDLAVGLANARTLDEGNPDQEWTIDFGGSLAPTLTDDGASGTAEVTTLGTDGSTDATAEWSFAC